MSTEDSLQLRILTGLHAGARATLDGKDVVIGSAQRCDIVLADDGLLPSHARLCCGGDGWTLHWLPETPDASPPGAPVALTPGVSVAIGPVIVSIDSADAPWPTLEQLVLAQSTGVFVPPPFQEPGPEADEGGQDVGPPGPGDPSAAASAWRRHVRRACMAIAGLVLVAAPLAFVAWTSPPAAGHAQQPTATPGPQPAPLAQRQDIERIVEALALKRHVVIVDKDGGWLVRASYVDDATAEKLLAALSQLKPRPLLHLTSEQDLPLDVADALARLMRDRAGSVTASYPGDGRMRLEGHMASVPDRDKLLSALQETFPQVRSWDAKVVVREEAAGQLLDELHAGGFEAVTGHWDADTFVMDVRLQQQQVPQWEAALARALARHPLQMRAVLSFTGAPAVASAAAGRLPFQVRSVVGGDAPYVVLAGGGRLQPDGSHMGWRLHAVEAQRVIFDNGNQRAVIPR